tara:strand:+ start:6973 stop:7161 length:189 start_codon:yes stop_codon:yes gene_type:complete
MSKTGLDYPLEIKGLMDPYSFKSYEYSKKLKPNKVIFDKLNKIKERIDQIESKLEENYHNKE